MQRLKSDQSLGNTCGFTLINRPQSQHMQHMMFRKEHPYTQERTVIPWTLLPIRGAIFFPPMTVNALPGPKPSNTVRGFAERIGNGVRSSNLKGDVAHVLKALSVDPILKYLRRLPLTLVQASQSIIRKCSDMKYVSGSIFNLIDERWESLWWALGTPDVSSFGHLASTCFWAITPFLCNKMTCYSINDITSVLF